MAIQADADLDFMLEDAGVPVSIGTSSTFGIFRREDVLESDGQGGFVNVRRSVLTIRLGTLAGLADDVDVTIDRVSFRVRNILDPTTRLVRVVVAA